MTSIAATSAAPRAVVFRHAIAFVLGFSLIFIALGASAGLAGAALQDGIVWFARIAGAGLIVMGLHLAGLIVIPPLAKSGQWGSGWPRRGPSGGLLRSAFVGVAFSVGWTPCVGPILAGILTLAATRADVVEATLLLTAYAGGMALPFLVLAALLGTTTRGVGRVSRVLPALEAAAGVLLVFMGMLIVLDRTTVLNSYFTFLPASVEGVSATSGSIAGTWGFAVAALGGVVSIVSPCMLPMVPIYLGHLAGAARGPRTASALASGAVNG